MNCTGDDCDDREVLSLNATPSSAIVLAMGPFGVRLLAAFIMWFMPKVSTTWTQLSKPRHIKMVVHAVNAVGYFIIFAVGCSIMSEVERDWGSQPRWILEHRSLLSGIGAIIPVDYAFHLSFSPKEGLDVWVHHIAASAMGTISLVSGFYFDANDTASLSFYGLAWAFGLSSNFPFHVAFVLYHFFSAPEGTGDCKNPVHHEPTDHDAEVIRLRRQWQATIAAVILWIPGTLIMNAVPIAVAVRHRHLLRNDNWIYFMLLFPLLVLPQTMYSIQSFVYIFRKADRRLSTAVISRRDSVFPEETGPSELSLADKHGGAAHRSSSFV